MAIIGNIDGSRFIGCPIVYPVTAGNVPAGATFHRVRLVVGISGVSVPFEFSIPAENGEKVYFDISSAFVAAAERFEYTADGLNPMAGGYPYWTHTADAYDDYLLNGVEHRGEGHSSSVDGGSFFAGRLTDRERLTGERPSRFSRKPKTSPEVVHNGRTFIFPGVLDQQMTTRVTPYVVGSDTIPAVANVYAIDPPADSFEMRFINSLGVHESIHVACLPQTDTHITTEQYVIARQETLTKFSRGATTKHDDYEQWKMSSGPLDRAWQQWYLHELLMVELVWIKVDGAWLQVHIIPEETVTGLDRTKAGALTVEFQIKFDINGSPFA